MAYSIEAVAPGFHKARQHRGSHTTPSPADIRDELARLIASPAFAKSLQLTQFLTYVVDEALAGRNDRIKAYSIAVTALGRDETFDPQADPIVRVEAGRLRRALGQYYDGPGRHDPVVIEVPVGHYTPVFRFNGTVQERGIMRRLNDSLRRLVEATATNPRQLMVMVIVAVIVSVALDLTAALFERTVVPALSSQSVPPTIYAQPDAGAPVAR